MYRRSWTSLPTPCISAQRLSERIVFQYIPYRDANGHNRNRVYFISLSGWHIKLTNRLILFWEITDYGKNNPNPKYTVWTKRKFVESGGADKQHSPCNGQKNIKLIFTLTK
jgi:hypothetical protein